MNRRNQSRIGGIVCWSCGKRGHLKRNCLKLKNDNGKGIRVDSADDVAAIADGNLDNADYVFFVIDNSSFGGWIIDSGCFFSCYIK